MPVVNLGFGRVVTEPERSCLCVICGDALGFHTFAQGCPMNARAANTLALEAGTPGHVARIYQLRDGVRWYAMGESLQW